MESLIICDYCKKDIPEDPGSVQVTLSTAGKIKIEWDACVSCKDVIERLLNKPIKRLQKALEAASDR